MEKEIIKERRQFTCGRCKKSWIPRRMDYTKTPNPKWCPYCNVKLDLIKPKIRIERTEIVKKILML